MRILVNIKLVIGLTLLSSLINKNINHWIIFESYFICNPVCETKGGAAATRLRANTGDRWEGVGNFQLNAAYQNSYRDFFPVILSSSILIP